MWSCLLTKISYLRRQLPTCCNRLHLGSVCDALECCLHRDLTSFWNWTIVLHENGFVSAITPEAHMLLRQLLGDCLSFLCMSDCITDRWSWPSESVPISLAEEGGSSTNPSLSSCPYAHACAHAVHHNLLLLKTFLLVSSVPNVVHAVLSPVFLLTSDGMFNTVMEGALGFSHQQYW